MRSAHFGLPKTQLGVCAQCSAAIKPHHACLACGEYAGRLVIDQTRVQERALKQVSSKSVKAESEKDVSETAKETKDSEAA